TRSTPPGGCAAQKCLRGMKYRIPSVGRAHLLYQSAEWLLAIPGIIGGAAILTAAPLSLQWSQKNVVLSLDSAKAGTATSAAGVRRRVHRRAYRRAAYGTAATGSGGYGYSSLANCGGEYLPYGTSYVAPCGQYSSSYAIAEERLKSGYSVAPFSYYGPSS